MDIIYGRISDIYATLSSETRKRRINELASSKTTTLECKRIRGFLAKTEGSSVRFQQSANLFKELVKGGRYPECSEFLFQLVHNMEIDCPVLRDDEEFDTWGALFKAAIDPTVVDYIITGAMVPYDVVDVYREKNPMVSMDKKAIESMASVIRTRAMRVMSRVMNIHYECGVQFYSFKWVGNRAALGDTLTWVMWDRQTESLPIASPSSSSTRKNPPPRTGDMFTRTPPVRYPRSGTKYMTVIKESGWVSHRKKPVDKKST